MDRRCRRGVSMTLLEILPSLRQANPRIDRAIWPLSAHVDELGRLCVGEMPLTEVANQFGTATYVSRRGRRPEHQHIPPTGFEINGAFGKQVRLEPGITYLGTAETAEMPKRVGCQTVVIRVVLVEEEFGIHDAQLGPDAVAAVHAIETRTQT